MTTRRKFAAVALATAAAAVFTAAPISVAQAGKGHSDVKCYGVNKCKGYNDCKTASNSCKGKASCKGQGFVKMSSHACEKIGGSVNKPKK